MNIYDKLKEYFQELIESRKITHESICINIMTLTGEEAIGNPIRQDYPLLNGKEVLIEADFRGCKGQAFTSARTEYTGVLSDLLTLNPGENDYDTAIFIASLNAIMRYYDLIEGTKHCKDEEPEECSSCICDFLRIQNRAAKILLIGYQPAMLQAIHNSGFSVRVLDLNPENIGKDRYGVLVEHGDLYPSAIDWADILLVTGSTIGNGSIINFMNQAKPTYFYGTTIAGPAAILGLNRLCFKSGS